MRQQIAFGQYNPNKPHRYDLQLKSLNDARFPYTYKAVPCAAKPKAGNTQNREIFSATCHFEKEKKGICLTSHTIKTKSGGKKNVVLSPSRLLHGKTIDDGKEKPQTMKFAKGGTDIAGQLNDYYITRSKSCPWVMVALLYILDTTRVNGKTVWCLKSNSAISRTSSYDFSWN